MKKIFTLLSLSIALSFTAGAANATYGWFLAGGGTGTGADYSVDVVTDPSGNIFYTSNFVDSMTFQKIGIKGAPKGSGASFDKNLYICKLSPDTVNLWNIHSNLGAVNPTALATTATGDLIVTGTIRAVKGGATTSANIIDAAGTATVFTDLGYQANDIQSFVAKFSSSGIVQWVKEFNSSASKDTLVETSALATDANGNVYMAGSFAKSVIFSGTSPITLTTNNTAKAAFITKLDGITGDAVWAKTSTGGIISETLAGLTYGDDGYLYAAGNYKNQATPVSTSFGGINFTPSITPDLVLIKLNTDGNVSYIQERPALATNTKGDARVKELIVKNGKAYMAGSFQGSYGGIQFKDGALTRTPAFLNGFIAAFQTSDGTDLWQKAIGSTAISEINGLAIGYDGNIYAFGYEYNGNNLVAATDCIFGDGFVLTDATNKSGDLFLVSYDPTTGTTKEVHWTGKGAGFETGNAMACFNDKLYLAGTGNSAPITFENTKDKYTSNGFDFILERYTVTKPTSIDNQKEVSTFAYYDKANQAIILKNAENVASVKIFDMTGRLVKAVTEKEDVSNINAQSINAGIFIVQTQTVNGQTASYKVAIN